MENNRITEEIRNYKLYKIQITDQKIREFENTFKKIEEKSIFKSIKDFSLNSFKIILLLLSILTVSFSIIFFFPELIISIIEKSTKSSLSQDNKTILLLNHNIFSYIFFSTSIILFILTYTVNKNIKNRNYTFKLHQLTNDIINHLKDISKDEKTKYEAYVENTK